MNEHPDRRSQAYPLALDSIVVSARGRVEKRQLLYEACLEVLGVIRA
jgi:hypothetical protein